MEDCIFCQIVAGRIPATKIYEDEDVLAFLDISQATKGHALLIPKQHVRNLFEMTSDTASHLFAHLPRLARAIKTATKAQGLNVVNNNEAIAGQTVFHAHVHLLPRYPDDGLDIRFKTHSPDSASLEKLAAQIAKEV